MLRMGRRESMQIKQPLTSSPPAIHAGVGRSRVLLFHAVVVVGFLHGPCDPGQIRRDGLVVKGRGKSLQSTCGAAPVRPSYSARVRRVSWGQHAQDSRLSRAARDETEPCEILRH